MVFSAGKAPRLSPEARRVSFHLPQVWQDLLAIESFAVLPYTPDRARGITQRSDDPMPYRDDYREIATVDHDLLIVAVLESSDTDYGLRFEVYHAEGVSSRVTHSTSLPTALEPADFSNARLINDPSMDTTQTLEDVTLRTARGMVHLHVILTRPEDEPLA